MASIQWTVLTGFLPPDQTRSPAREFAHGGPSGVGANCDESSVMPFVRWRLTSGTLVLISPLTLGPTVRRSATAPAHQATLLFTATEPRRAARRGIKINEAHLSTLETCPQAPARISCSHGHQGWPRSGRRTPQPRPQAAVSLKRKANPCRRPASPGASFLDGFANALSFWLSAAVKSAGGGYSCWK